MFNSKENVEETMVLNGGIDVELSSALDNTFSRSSSSKESLNRELKKKIRKNISDWNYIDSLISTLIPEQLIELEIFLWNEAIEFAEGALQKKLAREFITAHMEPTANYHRRQMCGEQGISRSLSDFFTSIWNVISKMKNHPVPFTLMYRFKRFLRKSSLALRC